MHLKIKAIEFYCAIAFAPSTANHQNNMQNTTPEIILCYFAEVCLGRGGGGEYHSIKMTLLAMLHDNHNAYIWLNDSQERFF